MDKILKNIINKTIEREYQGIGENYMDNLKQVPELLKDHTELEDKMVSAMHKLQELLPKEYHYLIDEMEEISVLQIGVNSRFMFRKGVLMGLSELKYLGEEVEGIAYI